MRSATVDDTEDASFSERLLLLNTAELGERLVAQLTMNSPLNVKSQCGIALPAEIWDIIIDYLENGQRTDEFCFVKASVVRPSPWSSDTTRLIRCKKQEFDLDLSKQWLAGHLCSAIAVLDFETFLLSPTAETADSIESTVIPDLHQLPGPENTFSIVLDSVHQTELGALGIDVDVPDIIAKFDYGDCCVCNGYRSICPGCTGGVADEFFVFMSCGASLACPLCLGLDLADKHHRFLKYDIEGETTPDEEDDINEKIRVALDDLGYVWREW